MKKVIYPLLLIIGTQVSSWAQSIQIKSNDSRIHYMGRIAMQDSAAQLSWPGTSVKINFTGTGVKALLKDEGDQNFYNVIVDGKVTAKLHPTLQKQQYTLATDLPAGKHTLELFKRTEWDKGKTWFYGFNIEGKKAAVLKAPVTKKRKIEFFGNSITCGYAVEDSSGKDRGSGPYENNYISYAAITARHFDAEYYCTAKSGIGMMVSWFPLIMPEMYNRLDATDARSKWDFSKYTPDVVVINVFQNDSWLVKQPNHEQFKARFGTTAPDSAYIVKAYQRFVQIIRKTYPKAHIICALGNMDATREGAPWPGYVSQAVKNINDAKIYTLFFPYKNTGGHPNAKEQQAMANDLIAFIDKKIKW
ncbi:electron transporter RnfD [Mucilaginibacter sp. Bleaf8]|uniref:SGNH/GDSL hydrolase family protein n=1 Tax=Mucilaginibacter sp. Bleaf8 TaxID=2834430 RepID=UPI001BCF4AFD|nr:SGNH/GDSL hydrolase family protein [Mucilaginibacter sp. Bleaf8]MBS7562971.1 electron transporter RnfD [Mucilaginibacter sp. Bleaf8]